MKLEERFTADPDAYVFLDDPESLYELDARGGVLANFNPYHGYHGRFAPSSASGYTDAHHAEYRALTKEGNAILKLRSSGKAEAHHHERLAAVKARKRVLEAIQRGEVEGPARESHVDTAAKAGAQHKGTQPEPVKPVEPVKPDKGAVRKAAKMEKVRALEAQGKLDKADALRAKHGLEPRVQEAAKAGASHKGGPAEKVTPEVERSHAKDVVDAAFKLGGAGTLIHLGNIREAVPHLSKGQFDAALQRARKAGKITLSAAEGRHGVTDKDRASAVYEVDPVTGRADHMLLYATLRAGTMGAEGTHRTPDLSARQPHDIHGALDDAVNPAREAIGHYAVSRDLAHSTDLRKRLYALGDVDVEALDHVLKDPGLRATATAATGAGYLHNEHFRKISAAYDEHERGDRSPSSVSRTLARIDSAREAILKDVVPALRAIGDHAKADFYEAHGPRVADALKNHLQREGGSASPPHADGPLVVKAIDVYTPKWLKEKHREFAKTLTKEEKSAVRKYTTHVAEEVNARMRAADGDVSKLSSKDRAFVEAVDSVVQKAGQLDKPIHTYRGLSLPQGVHDALMASFAEAHAKGAELKLPSLTSTSIDPSNAIAFSGHGSPGAGTSLVMRIRAKSGVHVDSLSRFEGEDELLLSHRAKYRVTGISDVHYRGYKDKVTVHRTVHLEEV